MVIPAQGEIWWAEAMDRQRPVLVISRSEAVPVLTWVLVAPVTRTVRDIPTEIPLGGDCGADGLDQPCVASFDNVQPIRRSFLTERLGVLTNARFEICRALAAMADC